MTGSLTPAEPSQIRCTPKHRAPTGSAAAKLRSRGDVRSRCPGWATERVQRCLLAEALTDPDGGFDSHGRPRKIWNAVAGIVFFGVSSNEPIPAYKCYPSEPVTALVDTLLTRAKRTVEALLAEDSVNAAP